MVKIAHLADIHIQDRRRAEYSAVFQALYADLRVKKPNLIVVAGDIFDNKMRASPHNLEDVANFLTNLVKIAPTIIIAGNHDTNCLTPGELDLLTPLISEHNMLQPPNLTYWRSSGVYHAHDMIWTVIATDGTQPSEEEERAFSSQYSSDLPHVCLFHEEVNGTSMPNGLAIGGFKLSSSSFSKYDLTMGGHIHLRQKISSRAAYCGSLIQQNIGEHHKGHGYIMWELSPSPLLGMYEPFKTAPPTMTTVDIPNTMGGFVRILIDRYGKDITELPIPETPLYWELLHTCELPPAQIVDEYTARFKMEPRAVRPKYALGGASAAGGAAGATTGSGTGSTSAAYDLSNAQLAARTIESHEAIIKDILQDQELSEAVLVMHRENWKDVPIIVGGRFRLLRFEFDNMYAFGTSNAIDFSSLEGCVSGVIAANHTGKSSLIEALLFALYEDHPRASTKKDVIHKGASSASMILEFELDGKIGRIEKSFTFGSHQQSQYKFQYNCEDRTRGGTTETLKEIESVLGGSINSLASSFQLQGGESGGFIGGNATARKKLLANVMSLGSFEGLENSVTRDIAATRGEIKSLTAQFHGISLETIDLDIKRMQEEKATISDMAVTMSKECDIARDVCVAASFRVGGATAALAAARQATEGFIRASPDMLDSKTPQELIILLNAKQTRAKAKLAVLEEAVVLLSTTTTPIIPTDANITQFNLATAALLASQDRLRAHEERMAEIDAELSRAGEAFGSAKYNETLLRKIISDVTALCGAATVVDTTTADAAVTTSDAAATTSDVTATTSLELAQESFELKKKWLEATKHAATISKRLHFNDSCSDCANTKSVFDKLKTKDVKNELVAAAKVYLVALNSRVNDLANLRELQSKKAALAGELNVIRETVKCNEEGLKTSTENMRGYTPESANAAKKEYEECVAAQQLRSRQIVKLRKFIADSEQEILIAMNADQAELVHHNADLAEKSLSEIVCELKLATTASDMVNDNLNKLTAQISTLNQDILRMTIEREYEAERLERYTRANKHQEVLKAYRTVLKPVGGIGDRLLEKSRKLLEQKINEALHELGAKFRIKIAQDYDIYILNDWVDIATTATRDTPLSANMHDKSVRSTLASGYQKFVLSLAARLAIWRLSTSPRPDAFIIDEGFGACDEEYLESMATALEALASAPGGPQLVFIVSHVDTLKTRLERYLEIEVLSTGSRVSNTIQQHIIRRTFTSNDTIASDVIGPDNEKIGNVYCKSCKQSLTVARLSKHLTSQKHTDSLKRMRKNKDSAE